MRRNVLRLSVATVMAFGMIGVSASGAFATKPDPLHKVTICHATASKTNPYVVITVDMASIVGESGHGISGVNQGDIIPPFTMDGIVYPGHNWDDAHRGLSDGCNIPDSQPPSQ